MFYETTANFLSIASELTAQNPAAPKQRREQRVFDDRGDLTAYRDFGDPDRPSSEVHYDIVWTGPDPVTNIDRPTDVIARPAPIALPLRKRSATYLPGKGVVDTVTDYVTGGNVPGSGSAGTAYNQAAAVRSFTYDTLGNLKTSTRSDRYTVEYTYDRRRGPSRRGSTTGRSATSRPPSMTTASASCRARQTSTPRATTGHSTCSVACAPSLVPITRLPSR